MQLGFLQCIAPRQHHQPDQQHQQSATADKPEKHGIGEQLINSAELWRLLSRLGRSHRRRRFFRRSWRRYRLNDWSRLGDRRLGLSFCSRWLLAVVKVRSLGFCGNNRRSSGLGWRCRYSRGFHDRRLPLRGEIRLQLGQLIIFQLNQTLQFIELTLQVTHAPFQLFVLAASGIQAFLSHRQLVAQRLAVGGTCVTATGCLAGIGGDQFQAVLSFRLGGSCAGDTAPGRIHLPCAGRNVTPLAPGGILFANLGHGFGLGAAFDLLLLRQAQHLAVLQAIDIAANKGIRIQILNGQHGLLYAAVTTHTLGDFP